MKIIVLNGSPRKDWNTSKMMESFLDGMKESTKSIEIEYINLYDYQFSGCRSCFACKLKHFEDQPLECRWKDDVYDTLVSARTADAIIIGSPIYFCDLSAQLKMFLERLMYPGKSIKTIPIACIYTMNAPKDAFYKVIENSIAITEKYLESNFGFKPIRICAFDTYQREHEHLYKKSSQDSAGKLIRKETQFPIDLKNAYESGKVFVKEIDKIV